MAASVLDRINKHVGEFKSRSQFIEIAARHFIAHLERREAERRDLEIINQRANALNEEAEDILTYQVPIEICIVTE